PLIFTLFPYTTLFRSAGLLSGNRASCFGVPHFDPGGPVAVFEGRGPCGCFWRLLHPDCIWQSRTRLVSVQDDDGVGRNFHGHLSRSVSYGGQATEQVNLGYDQAAGFTEARGAAGSSDPGSFT